MAAITASSAERLDRDAATLPIGEVAAYLQEQLGQRMAAFLAGLADAKQIGRYARATVLHRDPPPRRPARLHAA